LSFYQTAGPHARVWVGLDHFRFILTDPDFWHALLNTTVFAIVSVTTMLPASLGLALLLNARRSRLRGFFRLVFFLPNVVAQTFVGIIFFVMFMPRYGLFNRFLQDVFEWGLETQWLSNPALVMPAIVLANAWLYTGLNMVYFLAALQNVSQDLMDAANIDGASPWQRFRNVILPEILPVGSFVVLLSIIGSLQLFELPWVLLTGANQPVPDERGWTVVVYLYHRGFITSDLGYASAVGWLLAVMLLGIAIAQRRLLLRREEYLTT